MTRTWTASAMTDECLEAARAATAALTRTVTGTILTPHKTQRLVVSGKTGFGNAGEQQVRAY
jgi:hypothetical protein